MLNIINYQRWCGLTPKGDTVSHLSRMAKIKERKKQTKLTSWPHQVPWRCGVTRIHALWRRILPVIPTLGVYLPCDPQSYFELCTWTMWKRSSVIGFPNCLSRFCHNAVPNWKHPKCPLTGKMGKQWQHFQMMVTTQQ